LKTPIPWLRILVEGVVIVGSILLAFGIDAWWDRVQERALEAEALVGLDADFRRYRAEAEFLMNSVSGEKTQIDFLFSLGGRSADAIPVSRADSAFRAMINASTWDPGEGTVDALTGAGRLALIQRDELRDLLTGWETRVLEVRDGEAVIRSFVRESLVPSLSRAGVPLMRAYRSTRPERPESLVSDVGAATVYARVLSDPGIRSLMAFRYNWAESSLREYGRSIQMIDQILALISEELGA